MPRIEPFERYSREYDEWFVRNREVYQAEVNVIKPLILPKEFGLEVGVGTGRFAVPLNVNIGVDPSKKMVDVAKERGLEVLLAVAEKLPFKNNVFDFVLMVTTICFVDDLFESLREAYRVLKTKGFIVVGFVDRESRLGKQYMSKKEKSRFYSSAIFYSTDDVIVFLKKSGFKVDVIKQTVFFSEEKMVGNVKDGYGEGSFVVIKASKDNVEEGE
ncbi:MAG: class I SAM-dependent methyltransferase [Thermoplasmata archaeon]|nr:class I SAM-dependent methyltransferase [Thermoplasmata archaeon]RLF28179.1 MAG: SAM-dependent methyltransferase [Thermoplasmata archaeon]